MRTYRGTVYTTFCQEHKGSDGPDDYWEMSIGLRIAYQGTSAGPSGGTYNRATGSWDPPDDGCIEAIRVDMLMGTRFFEAPTWLAEWALEWLHSDEDYEAIELNHDDGPDPDYLRDCAMDRRMERC